MVGGFGDELGIGFVNGFVIGFVNAFVDAFVTCSFIVSIIDSFTGSSDASITDLSSDSPGKSPAPALESTEACEASSDVGNNSSFPAVIATATARLTTHIASPTVIVANG